VRECPGGKPGRGVKAEGGITVARGGKGKASAPCGPGPPAPPADPDFLEGFEPERTRWDPKDCVSRLVRRPRLKRSHSSTSQDANEGRVSEGLKLSAG